MKEKLKMSWMLFLFFAKIGCFTFGGGWSILAQMEQEYVEKKKIITKEELLDIVSIGKSVPGIMITNISTIFGYQIAGGWGAIASMIGISLPPIIILSILTIGYAVLKDNVWVAGALQGVRAAVVPIIASATLSLGKAGLKNKMCWGICIIASILCYFTDLNNIVIVLMGLAFAFILMGIKQYGTN